MKTKTMKKTEKTERTKDKAKGKTKDGYSPLFYWLVKTISYFWSKWKQNIRYYVPREIKALRGPFIVCSNHVGVWDPFLICKPFYNGVRYITSDAAFRAPAKNWFLRKLGSIPKTKGMRDSDTIRGIIKVIKKKQVIGLFPEGDRSYEGKTMPLNDATGKMIKKLNIPVVVVRNCGTSFSHPRWSNKPNKGRVEFHYRFLYQPEDLQSKDPETIQRELQEALDNDDTVWQEEKQISYVSGHRAEKIEHPLFICPACDSIASIYSGVSEVKAQGFAPGDAFACNECGASWRVNNLGFFVPLNEGKIYHNNLRDWFAWQREALQKRFRSTKDDEDIFADEGATLYTGRKMDPLQEMGQGRSRFTARGIHFVFEENDTRTDKFFPAEELKGITIQEGETLEFYHGDQCYQITHDHFVSACKYGTALEELQKVLGAPKD